MGKILDRLMDVLATFACLLLVFITLIITYTISARYLSLPVPVWVVQFSEYALLWITFLGAAWLLRKGKHVKIDLLTILLSRRGQRIAGILHSAIGAVLCAVLAWYAGQLVWDNFQRGVIDIRAVDVPKYAVVLIIPLGFILLVVQFFRDFVKGMIKRH